MSDIIYTIIIPHKNSVDLLKRCLQSIPSRNDVQVIVVDDNSTEFDKVKEAVAGFAYVCLYKNEGYGAGGARNTGLKNAKGKWLLFADCDDYYVEGFLNTLDQYIETDYDIVYFNFYQYIDGQDEPIYEKISNYITECATGRIDIDYVKFRNNTPWDKMIRKSFVETYHIRFEEQPIGNDIFFSYQVGYLSKKQKVIDSKLYNYIIYRRSQTKRNWDNYKIKTFMENLQKYNGFMNFIGHKDWTHGFLYLCFQMYKMKDFGMIVKSLRYYFSHFSERKSARDKYPKLLREKVNLLNIKQ